MNPSKPYITVAERKNLCKLNDMLKQFNKGVDTTGELIERILTAEGINAKSPTLKAARDKTTERLTVQLNKLAKIRHLLDNYDKHNLLQDQFSIITDKIKNQFENFIQLKTITIDISKDDVPVI